MQEHVKSLKEMVLLPLIYPEVFARFHVDPPRGVIFHGIVESMLECLFISANT